VDNKKEIFIINAKLKFINNKEEVIPFYVEANNNKHAEKKLEDYLKKDNSGYNFIEILCIWTKNNIYVIK